MAANIDKISEAIREQKPISKEDARTLFVSATDDQLKSLATLVRNRHHPSDEASYIIMAIINYTNICVAKCDYCAFYKLPNEKGGYLLSFDQVCEKIDELRKFGGTLVDFNGGFNPKIKIKDYADLFRKLHDRYPSDLEFFEMTVSEFMFSCKMSKISYAEGAKLLKEAGTHWITGGGAEILDDDFRQRHSPLKYSVEDYFIAQKAIIEAEINSTATMVIGFDETVEERLNHLEALRNFQDETNHSLPSFLCWTYKPFNNKLGGKEISSQEYMRWLAVCRIYLHNFKHIRTSILTKNEDALMGLKYGANDFDLVTEDEVVTKAGATINLEFDSILKAIKEIGLTPVQRAPLPRLPSFPV